MQPTTPTLPTVIITPSTPLYLLPSRQSYMHKPFPFSPRGSEYTFSSPNSASSSSSSRQYTRKQHLISALALDSEKQAGGAGGQMDHTLLLPPPLHLSQPQPRRRPTGILLSLLVLGLFALILVGPTLPYRWWTAASTGGEVPELALPDATGPGLETSEVALSTVQAAAADDESSMGRRWEAYGPGQGGDPRYTKAFGPGQEQMPNEPEQRRSQGWMAVLAELD